MFSYVYLCICRLRLGDPCRTFRRGYRIDLKFPADLTITSPESLLLDNGNPPPPIVPQPANNDLYRNQVAWGLVKGEIKNESATKTTSKRLSDKPPTFFFSTKFQMNFQQIVFGKWIREFNSGRFRFKENDKSKIRKR